MSHTIRTTLAIAAVTAAGATVLAGCSSDSSGSSPSTQSSAQSSTQSSTTNSSGTAGGSADLTQALITTADLGTGFTIDTSPVSDDPLPCTPNDPPLFTRFKPAQKASKQFADSAKSLSVAEDVAVFDSGVAEKAFAAAVKGFSCSTGTIGQSTIKIVKRPGSGAASGDMESAAWDATNGENLATAAILRIGDKIAAMSFQATKATANDINVNTVLAKAGTKLAALT